MNTNIYTMTGAFILTVQELCPLAKATVKEGDYHNNIGFTVQFRNSEAYEVRDFSWISRTKNPSIAGQAMARELIRRILRWPESMVEMQAQDARAIANRGA